MKHKTFSTFGLLFALLFILTVPFPHQYIPDIAGYLQPIFESLVKFTGKYIFNINHAYTIQLVSDSTGLYIHAFNLAIISAICTFIVVFKPIKNYDKILYWSTVIISYYLALQLFEYGFSKLFKWQFYLPEPNTLFSTMGNTYHDLMYWSTMGVSRPYTVFAGVAEIIAACLLLFNRTRLAGALLAFFVLANVVAINFSYDISVKILSSFLLLLSIIIIAPDAQRLLSFFFNKKINDPKKNILIYTTTKSKWIYRCIKICTIGYILFSTLSVYFVENNFNDDEADRPLFHGAYDATVFTKNNDTHLPLLTDTIRWKRAFVHRRGYFITQQMNDNVQDYKLTIDTLDHLFILDREEDEKKFKFNYTLFSDNSFTLQGVMDRDTITVHLQPIDLKQLPALQHEFNWTIDN